ncbi:RNA polymerase factor sigma-32 [Nannocystis sp. SCPEA4]|uniref:RNA polymerase factor sigma-32 n=1 Tax=Nannocystis sp. SCPEA4 TaxID=2996787 RepID=UPI0022708743|nr:RNA polymerase factor sigma-32 [Nannocystis sp. SCPEA4]MCY1056055.1 RNA polymerase factor sigma-32 [Nannocystis sp. SCPEA4]
MSQPKRSSSEKSSRKAPAVVDVEAPGDAALPVKATPVAPEPEPDEEEADEEAEVLGETEPATDAELDLIEAEIGTTPPGTPTAAPVTALVRRDPMGQYMAEVRRHPLLTREEEHALAVRWVEQGDAEAAKQLVTSNLRLVVKIAHEYKRAYQNLLDLVQEGNVGLIQAVKKFDPYRGVKLSTYSGWWIRAYILKFILNNWRLVKIGTTQNQRKLFFNLRKQVDRLKQAGVDPTPERIAAALDVSEAEVIEMDRRLSAPDMSLDAPLSSGDEDDGRTRMDIIEDSSDDPEVEVESTEFKDILHAKLRRFGATLSGRELEIFRDRIVADEPITLQELGDRWGVSRERARQLEKRMVLRLREFLQAELGDAVQIALGHDT